MNLKKLLVPFSNEVKAIDVAQLWEVRWQSVEVELGYGLCHHQPEMETFLTEKEAKDFQCSLERAIDLLKIEGIKVTMRKAAH